MTSRGVRFFVILAASGAMAAPLPRTVSTSLQFIVFGGDTHLRGSVAQAAERTKAELLTFLQSPDRWSIPILFNLGQPQTNVPEIPAVALNFSQTGTGLKIQLDLLVDRAFDPAILRRETLRALLLEMSYRALPSLPAGESYNPPPDWLVDGILSFNDPSPEFRDALETAEPPPLKKLLGLHPGLLDSQSRTLYRAHSAALVRMLTTTPDGRERLARFINDWPQAASDALADLRAHFPALGKNDDELEKNWRASIGRAASEQRFALRTFESSSEELDKALADPIAHDASGKKALTLLEAVHTAHAKIDSEAARQLGRRLILLGAQTHPLLRAIVADYRVAAESLANHRTRGLSKRLAATVALRQRVAERMKEVEDYMNWFQATQAHTSSGTFRDYLRAAEASDAAPRRRDPISIYLDAMETQVQ